MWTCANCEEVVDDGFEVCWSCGSSRDGEPDPLFVTADEAGPIFDPIFDLEPEIASQADPWDELDGSKKAAEPLVVFFKARDMFEANVVGEGLAEAGIACLIDRRNSFTVQSWIVVGDRAPGPGIAVKPIDLDRARAWVEAYLQRQHASPAGDPPIDEI